MNEEDQHVRNAGSRFELRVMKVMRGREPTTRAKMQDQGWEFVSQSTGTMRTEMTFRRPKPKSPVAYLAAGWASFRNLPSKAQAGLATVSGLAVLMLVVAAALSGNGDRGPSPSAATPASTGRVTSSGAHSGSASGKPPESSPAPSQSTTSQSASPSGDQVITVKNSTDFAALARTGDYCADAVQAFATKYQGRTVEFDGSVGAVNNHGTNRTRYDILISMGSKGSEATLGPAFQFNNVGMYDLHLKGGVPETVGVDDRLHIVAELGDFMPQHGCLYMLDPISTEVR